MSQIRPYPKCLFSEVPVGWKKIRLRFALTINPSKSELLLQNTELVSFIPMDAIGEYGGIRLNEEKEVGDIGSGYTYFRDGDIVVAKITPCFENGKGALAKGLKNKAAFGTTEIYVLRADLGQLEPRFLFYLTISSLFRKLGEAEMHGAGGQKRVPERFIKDFYAGLPPLQKQQVIVDYLDLKTTQIDALIAKKQALLDKLAEKRMALISRAVTKGLDPSAPMKDSGVAWLGEIPAHWIVCLLKRISEISYGVGGEIDRSLTEGVSLLSLPNITKDGKLLIDEISHCELSDAEKNNLLLKKGDLLFNWRNGSSEHLGKTAYFKLDGEWTHVSFLLRIRLNVAKSEPRFYQYMLSGLRITGFFSSSKAGVNNTFNMFELANLFVLRPPLDEQQEISDMLDSKLRHIDTQVKQISAAIDRLAEYRSTLITHAVTGKIDIRNHPIP